MEPKFRNEEVILDIHDKPNGLQWLGLSLQHVFTMFGATVLVPILVGIDPGIALISSGLGTMAHLFVTKGKIPAYMGSSFAYIAILQSLLKTNGYGAVAQGAITAGIVYLVVAFIIKKVGSGWMDKILPPIVVGPVIMVIGLGLASSAANNAMYRTLEDGVSQIYDIKYIAVALITLALTIIFNMYLKGFFGLIPILLGIVVGYVIAILFGIVDLEPVKESAWLTVPDFQVPFLQYTPHFYPGAMLAMAPIAFVTMTEHIGHLMVLNKITKRDFFKDPGLSRTLAGDAVAQIIAGLIGGPPVTSYGENIGVMIITKVHSVFVIAGAAFLAVGLGFVGKLTMLIRSIPGPVIGGISFLLFGVIASSGLKIIIENQINLDKKRNLIIASVILVVGIGGLTFKYGNFHLEGMALATLFGIVLNLILPQEASSEK